MKKCIILFAVTAFSLSFVHAQNVTVSSAVGQNIGTFINNEIVGSGVYIFNAKFNGMSGNVRAQWPQVGTFQANGFGGLSMENGIVLTTGNVSVAAGPNNSSGSSSSVNPYVDPEMASNSVTNNAKSCATIDFDFVCLSNSVSFQYCFGSEEYNEYVFSQYNDVFVFLLTGPDPVTGDTVTRNIAMIPNTVDAQHPTGIPVAINTVNNGTAGTSGSYPCAGCYNNYTEYFVNNDYNYSGSPIDGIQYDGYTTKLTASGSIMPCAQYHMHISICNVQDQAFDSGVFLEGHSLNSPTVEIGLSRPTTDTIRRSTPLTVPLAIANSEFDHANVKVRFGGEAISGIDYFFLAADGTVINNAENITVTNAPTYFTIQPITSANFTTPKTLDLYFASSLCDEHPEFTLPDTMHFILAEDVDNSGIITNNSTSNTQLSVYPNPASGRITLSAPEAMQHVDIYDIEGREVYSSAVAESQTLSIDVSRLTRGVYTVQAITRSGIITSRMVIQ